MAEQRTRAFSVGPLVNLLTLVFEIEHGSRRGDSGSRREANNSFPGRYCLLC